MNSVCYAILGSGPAWRVASAAGADGPYASRAEALAAALDRACGVIDAGRPVELVYADPAGRPRALRLGPSHTLAAPRTL